MSADRSRLFRGLNYRSAEIVYVIRTGCTPVASDFTVIAESP
jgi:hypothetical protein